MSALVNDEKAGIVTADLPPVGGRAGSYNYFAPAHALISSVAVFKPSSAPHPFANSVYLMPHVVPKGMTVDAYILDVTTLQAGTTFTGLLYENDDGLPGNLITYGAAGTLASTGVQSSDFGTGGGDWVSDGKMIWAGFWADSSTARLNVLDIGATGNNDGELTGVIPMMGLNISFAPLGAYWYVSGGAYAAGTPPVISGAITAFTDVFKAMLRAV